MEVVVTGAFMTSPDAVPPRTRVAPSRDPDNPTIAHVPAWAFARHFKLGNCVTRDAYEARMELQRETERQLSEVKNLEAELGERALRESQKLAIQEEISALDEIDDKDQLAAIARQHGFSVSTRGAVKVVRSRVQSGLQKQLADLPEDGAPPDDADSD